METCFNGLKIKFDKRYELISGLFSSYIKFKNNSDFDWVESPDDEYVNELCKLIDINGHSELFKYIESGLTNDCSNIAYIAFAFNDDFLLNEDLLSENIKNSFEYGNAYDFGYHVKKLVDEKEYNLFFKKYEQKNMKIINELNGFFKDINFEKIAWFYNSKNISYVLIYSLLINGAFAYVNESEKCCIFGVKKVKDGTYDFTVEPTISLFHEYSHPHVNPLVDKYFNHFKNADNLYNESILNHLPKTYHKQKTLLYEYFVRANSYVMAEEFIDCKKHIKYWEKNGFRHLKKIIEITKAKRTEYSDYESLFIEELVPLINKLS